VTRIGPIPLPIPFCQAGLAGYSDRAMRTVARRRGCPYAVTEAILDTILLTGGLGRDHAIDINDTDHPVAGQLIGSDPDTMARAAAMLAEADYDAIDLNFACPVKKIKNKARGGHMLRDVPRAVAILRAVRDAVRIPLTVSLRRGFDDSPESFDRFHRIFEAAWAHGCSAVRVHARTVEQKYLGPSRWEFLRQLKASNPNRTILGSGDVLTAEDAVRMRRETGVDIVWIARGAIGNPWIFSQASGLLDGRTPEPPTVFDQRDALSEATAQHRAD
jgi:nifR3 family TIM-barrel protein